MGASVTGGDTGEIGSLCIVLHTHLPWLAHHGTWPVGEEWLNQAWAHSYLPVLEVLESHARQGSRDLLSIGITPVLAAQWDDPYCIAAQHTWLGDWQVRAAGLAGERNEQRRAAGQHEFAAATHALEVFESSWSRGGSPLLRRLQDANVVEILGGPLAHAFTPSLDDHWAGATLASGLDDATLRLGGTPQGIWTPECAYRPGLDQVFAAAGVDHLMLEGPTLLSAGATTSQPWLLGDSQVRVVGRDLPLAYRVWSPRRGYPGGRWYRDFHTFDHQWGLHLHRVTGRTIPPEQKAPYNAEQARAAVTKDARDFVDAVRTHLLEQRRGNGDRPALAVVAYDTELFGHWWHEGPQWLDEVLRLLPQAGVAPRSLSGALAVHDPAGRVHPGEGSWGSGKDFRVWSSPETSSLRAAQLDTWNRVRAMLSSALSSVPVTASARDPRRDQIVTSLLLGLASDWVFMITKGSAVEYARERATGHLSDVNTMLDALDDPRDPHWHTIAERDRPWGHVDHRRFASA